jgi:hypothetical protein
MAHGRLNSCVLATIKENSARATRSSANPLNLKMRQGRLEIRRNFFSNRIVSSWNDIPSDIGRQQGVRTFGESTNG